MAKVDGNIFMDRLSGMIGDQIIIKKVRGGQTIISKKASFNGKREFTPAQLAQQQAFREATAYGKMMQGEEIYITKADGGAMSPYNIAVADWFNRPEILEIDLSAWSGEAGQVLRIRAQDDVQVKRVSVVIADETDNVLEQGQAVEVGALWWEYTTTATASGNARVIVRALDLPGRAAERSEEKALG